MEDEKILFIGRHDNECVYVVKAASRSEAIDLLNNITGYEGDAWDLEEVDNDDGKVIEHVK